MAAEATTCPFCAQWNPAGNPRCSFCGNPLDAADDVTVAGRPAYEQKLSGPLPDVTNSPRPARSIRAGRVTIHLSQDQWIGVGVMLLIVIVLLSSRC